MVLVNKIFSKDSDLLGISFW